MSLASDKVDAAAAADAAALLEFDEAKAARRVGIAARATMLREASPRAEDTGAVEMIVVRARRHDRTRVPPRRMRVLQVMDTARAQAGIHLGRAEAARVVVGDMRDNAGKATA